MLIIRFLAFYPFSPEYRDAFNRSAMEEVARMSRWQTFWLGVGAAVTVYGVSCLLK
jgi:hypothetical protein